MSDIHQFKLLKLKHFLFSLAFIHSLRSPLADLTNEGN